MNTTPNAHTIRASRSPEKRSRPAWRDYDTRRPSPLRDFALASLALASVVIPAWLALVVLGIVWG